MILLLLPVVALGRVLLDLGDRQLGKHIERLSRQKRRTPATRFDCDAALRRLQRPRLVVLLRHDCEGGRGVVSECVEGGEDERGGALRVTRLVQPVNGSLRHAERGKVSGARARRETQRQ